MRHSALCGLIFLSLLAVPVHAAGRPTPAPAAAGSPTTPQAKAAATPVPGPSAKPEPYTWMEFGRFPRVAVYGDPAKATSVALFVSGDEGWVPDVGGMAEEVASLNAVVVGIDISQFFDGLRKDKSKCLYLAADLEAVSHFIQKKLNMPVYHLPVLIGSTSGAALVYAVLAQAPPNTFAGAMGLGFCPNLEWPKQMCHGNGLAWDPDKKDAKGVVFRPAKHLEQPFVALEGTQDPVCGPSITGDYMKQVKNGEMVPLEGVGHNFTVSKDWMPQFKENYLRLANPKGPASGQGNADLSDLSDLPIVQLPAAGGKDVDEVAIIVSGDGGWASIDREIGQTLANEGIPVVGLNSLQYFWKARKPDETGYDMERIVRSSLKGTGKGHAILVGYSLGADVLPFMASRLSNDLRSKVSGLVLLGPSPRANFQFHVTDWLGGPAADPGLPTLPEVQKLQGTPILCLYGDSETDSLCPQLPASLATSVVSKGGHHLGGNYQGLATTILQKLGLSKDGGH